MGSVPTASFVTVSFSVLTKIHPAAGREVDECRDDGARSHVAVIALPRHSHLSAAEPVGRRVLRWSQRIAAPCSCYVSR